jgi:hypothetical protein
MHDGVRVSNSFAIENRIREQDEVFQKAQNDILASVNEIKSASYSGVIDSKHSK